MDSFTFQEDVPTYSQDVFSFPGGVPEAHAMMREQLPLHERRRFFGVSWRDKDGGMVYKALAEKLDDEADPGMETFVIRNGPYNSFYINNFPEDPNKIRKAFDVLTKQHEVDPDGYCLEWYINEHDVKCMVPLGNAYQPFTGANDAPI
jgi:hypothetical protein